MERKIDQKFLKVRGFSSEIEADLDPSLRTFVTAECDIFEESYPNNEDGTFNKVYRAKLVGSTVIKQAGSKEAFIGKSKRSPSQKLRVALWNINPEESFYEAMVDKMVANAEEVIQFLKDK